MTLPDNIYNIHFYIVEIKSSIYPTKIIKRTIGWKGQMTDRK